MQTDLLAAVDVPVPDGIPEDVARLFEEYALAVVRSGMPHFSSDAILHRIRWNMQVERGHRDFKCNNNWTAALARWFMQRHPLHAGFFETRVLKKDRRNADADA
jgi:hypothetical protein